jgi:hypothetical protein
MEVLAVQVFSEPSKKMVLLSLLPIQPNCNITIILGIKMPVFFILNLLLVSDSLTLHKCNGMITPLLKLTCKLLLPFSIVILNTIKIIFSLQENLMPESIFLIWPQPLINTTLSILMKPSISKESLLEMVAPTPLNVNSSTNLLTLSRLTLSMTKECILLI